MECEHVFKGHADGVTCMRCGLRMSAKEYAEYLNPPQHDPEQPTKGKPEQDIKPEANQEPKPEQDPNTTPNEEPKGDPVKETEPEEATKEEPKAPKKPQRARKPKEEPKHD